MLNQKSRESRGVCRDWFTGHRAGLARRAQFYQLAAQCVEFDHVVYVCPIWTNHQKHAQYHLCSLHEAITLVYKTLQYFCQNEASIRGKVPNLPKSLSSLMLMWPRKNSVGFFFFLQLGLQRLDDLSTPMDYTFTNLLSCLTLDAENCHSVVHHKSPSCTVLQYTRNFGNTVKESVMKTTNWAAIYFTNP